jgi:hypothetical protein
LKFFQPMNYVTAQGAPNSAIRHFQEHPAHAVDLMDACKDALTTLTHTDTGTAQLRERLRHAISAVQEHVRSYSATPERSGV